MEIKIGWGEKTESQGTTTKNLVFVSKKERGKKA